MILKKRKFFTKVKFSKNIFLNHFLSNYSIISIFENPLSNNSEIIFRRVNP